MIRRETPSRPRRHISVPLSSTATSRAIPSRGLGMSGCCSPVLDEECALHQRDKDNCHPSAKIDCLSGTISCCQETVEEGTFLGKEGACAAAKVAQGVGSGAGGGRADNDHPHPRDRSGD